VGNNLEHVKAQQKANTVKNKDNKSTYDTNYREINKEKLAKRYKETFICECGQKYTRLHKNRHEGTARHKKFIETAI
jgi:hypothetical protein